MVLVESDHSTPLVRFKIQSPMGAVFDPKGFEGLTHHALALARSGTKKKSREDLDMAIDSLGASLDFRCAYHWVSLEGSVLSQHLDPLFSLAIDILGDALFLESDLSRLLRETHTALSEIQDDGEHLLTLNYRNHAKVFQPYHRPIIGTPSSLKHITLKKTTDWFKGLFPANETIFGISGDITKERANALFEKLPKASPSTKAHFKAPLFEESVESDKTFYYQNKPSNEQCNMELAFNAPRCQDDLYPALLLANSVLGELESSRLNQSIRAKEGWVYSVYSSIERHPDKNLLTITCNPALKFTQSTIETILNTLSALANEGLATEEFDLAKSNIIGSLDFVGETCHRRMFIECRNSLFGLSSTYYADLKTRLLTTSIEDVNEFLKTFFGTQHTTVGLVGPWDGLATIKESLPFTFKEMTYEAP